MRGLRVVAMTIAASSLGGCAWSNPDNRPVWNAVEEHLVPKSDGLFYATLPFTVVLGLSAFLVDTFVAHPIQVADDAFWDAGELWSPRRLDYDTNYYTEMAVTPFRAVGTPVVGTLSFVARSLFDIPPRENDPEEADEEAVVESPAEVERRNFLVWLDYVQAHPDEWSFQTSAPTAPAPDAELRERFAALMTEGTAAQRLRLHLGMILEPFDGYDPTAAMQDPDPVVRFHVLRAHQRRGRIPPALRELGRKDAVASIRELCR